MISFRVDQVVPESGICPVEPTIVAVNHPVAVTAGQLLNCPAIHIDSAEDDLPAEGLMIAAT
jgi:hypothetical protein